MYRHTHTHCQHYRVSAPSHWSRINWCFFVSLAVKRKDVIQWVIEGRPGLALAIMANPSAEGLKVTTHPLAAILEVLSSFTTVVSASGVCKTGSLHRQHDWYLFCFWLVIVSLTSLICLQVSLSLNWSLIWSANCAVKTRPGAPADVNMNSVSC